MGIFDSVGQIMQLKNAYSQDPNGLIQSILNSNPNTQQMASQSFNGDARSVVQRLLNSGVVDQSGLNRALEQAKGVYSMLTNRY